MVKIGALLTLVGCVDGDAIRMPGEVTISPSSPSTKKDLKCKVKNWEDVTFEYHWFADEEWLYSSVGVESRLNRGYTRPEDTISCNVFQPDSYYFEGGPIGYDTVYID